MFLVGASGRCRQPRGRAGVGEPRVRSGAGTQEREISGHGTWRSSWRDSREGNVKITLRPSSHLNKYETRGFRSTTGAGGGRGGRDQSLRAASHFVGKKQMT